MREIIRAGADVIKVATTGGVLSPRDDPRHPHFRDREIAVLTEEADAAGIHVMAHAQGAGGIKAALRNGVRSIEHGIFLDDEAIDLMLQRGAWLVPTLHAPRAVIAAAEAGMPIPASSVEKARVTAAAHADSVRRAHEAGVRIAMGTDCGVGAHGTNLEELELMTEAGMSPTDALHATTGSAAELLDVAADRGTIRPGLRADLVVVDGSPDDVTDLGERVRAVYLDGPGSACGAEGPGARASTERDVRRTLEGMVQSVRRPDDPVSGVTAESRGERKERTRRQILDAALDLCEDSSLVALSLRQVAKEVGIVPTAFYRHFDSIEDLGLALVEESFVSLREMLQDVRRSDPTYRTIIDSSVRVLAEHTAAQHSHFAFIARERVAGPPAVRAAIRHQIDLVERELATDLARLTDPAHWSTEDLRVLSNLIVTLDGRRDRDDRERPPRDRADHPGAGHAPSCGCCSWAHCTGARDPDVAALSGRAACPSRG